MKMCENGAIFFKSGDKQARTLQTEWHLYFSLEKFHIIKLPLKQK